MRIVVTLGVILATFVATVSGTLAGPFDDLIPKRDWNLSEAETQRVTQGEIVMRETQDGSLGGLAIAYVKANPEAVWSAVTDFSHYVDFMPGTLKMVIHENNAQTARLTATYANVWPFDDILITSDNHFDKSNPETLRMAWIATETNMKNAKGYWIVQKFKDGCLVYYEMNFDLNWIPRALARSQGRERVHNVVAATRDRSLELRVKAKKTPPQDL